jgi:hypothetical protein
MYLGIILWGFPLPVNDYSAGYELQLMNLDLMINSIAKLMTYNL